MHRLLLLLLFGFLLAAPARAQYALRADVTSAGATDAAGGSYRLRGTLGQAVIGPVAGGAFALGQGYWYAATAGATGPLVDLTLTPIDPPPPVSIRRGERLRYRADFAIAADGPSQFEYWAEATLPNNQIRFLFGPVTVIGTPGTTVSLTLQQRVPGRAPLGNYAFRMKVGTYPGTVYDEDSFPVSVVAGALLAGRPLDRRGMAGSGATRGAGRTGERGATAAQATDAAVRTHAPTDVPAEIARRIAAAPDAWLAWDDDGAILEAGLVQDLRLPDEPARRLAERDGADTPPARTALASAALSHVEDAPVVAALAAPFPNPTTGRTTLRLGLPTAGVARLAVYDALGRRVALLVDGVREAGWHEAVLDGGRLPSGVYHVRLEAAGRVLSHRLTLLR